MGVTPATPTPSRDGDDVNLAEALDDDRLTLAGLFAESWSGFAHETEARLRQVSDLPMQWFVLLLRVARSPRSRLRLSDLATQTGMSPSGLTRALDRIEEAGYVERVACPDDRRSTWATLTHAGQAVLGPAVTAHLGHLDEVLLDVLSDREREAFEAILRKVRDHVNPGAAQPPTPAPD